MLDKSAINYSLPPYEVYSSSLAASFTKETRVLVQTGSSIIISLSSVPYPISRTSIDPKEIDPARNASVWAVLTYANV
jgi:hypothetical protein